PALAMMHCENGGICELLTDEVMKTGRTDHRAYNDARPRFAEVEFMSRALYLAQAASCPLYVVHITVGEGPELLAWAKARGVKVMGETCPQYLTHSSEDAVPLLQDNPVLTKVNPPLRDKWSNEKLWEGIKLGLIESIGADHSPRKVAEKEGTVWQSRPGLGNTTEMILPVMLSEGYHKRGIPLTKVVELCSYNPARFFGVYPRKGSLAPGSDADLVVVDLDKDVKVSAANLHSRCDYNIYDGWECRGWPVMTLLRGQIVTENGVITGKPGIGQYIAR
ncbi:MAG: amidohydrolase family protein, partial [Chloroflexi bacterium]|nr:amidohydrolase family protein [Chloroflexota bacterium]